jgi:hypothetical protein
MRSKTNKLFDDDADDEVLWNDMYYLETVVKFLNKKLRDRNIK